MTSRYEIWLLDDGGNRLCLLDDFDYFSYSRSATGFGQFEIGIPYDLFVKKVFPLFQVDRRIDVWRAPAEDMPLRREKTYLLRMYRIYTRDTDAMQIVQLYGRDPKDLLRRRYIIQAAGTTYTRKTNFIDDMMKEIVREQMLFGSCVDPDGVVDNDRAYPEREFSVQEDISLGPEVTYSFADRNVLDVLKELHNTSEKLARDNTANQKIYFDIVPYQLGEVDDYILLEQYPNSPIILEDGFPFLLEKQLLDSKVLGWQFQTFAGLRGFDLTSSSLVFNVENENLEKPYYSLSHMEEANVVIVKGYGRGDSRAWDTVTGDTVTESRWNRVEIFRDASSEPDQDKLADYGYDTLWSSRAEEKLSAVFLNHPGSDDIPRSLYGVDWDLGDLLPVEYAGKRIDVEVDIVYVSINTKGEENISGMSNVNLTG